MKISHNNEFLFSHFIGSRLTNPKDRVPFP